MIFDYQLMFTDDNTAFTSVTNGVVGRVLDLGAPGQGKGRSGRIAFMFNKSVTSGGPVSFTLETADNSSFSSSKKIPFSLPPLTVADMAEGTSYAAPLPVVGLERYCRLNVTSAAAVTLTGMESGFVLDANEP